MPRSKARLAPEEMTTTALWDRGFWLCSALRWEAQYTLNQKEAMLAELCGVLQELHARGDQLQLFLDLPDLPAS